jgi:hypothetical protein
MRFGQVECEHGMPGGTPATCALCRVQLARQAEDAARLADLERWTDVRQLAAADHG